MTRPEQLEGMYSATEAGDGVVLQGYVGASRVDAIARAQRANLRLAQGDAGEVSGVALAVPDPQLLRPSLTRTKEPGSRSCSLFYFSLSYFDVAGTESAVAAGAGTAGRVVETVPLICAFCFDPMV